jgi:phosphoribosylanthranilate isomerase
VLKAVRLGRREDLEVLRAYPGLPAYLLDAAGADGLGGSGVAFDWSWAVEAKRFGRVILAGGLHPGNVEEAVRRVRPWGVDVCTGTDAAPGRKDLEKVREFLAGARRAAEESP